MCSTVRSISNVRTCGTARSRVDAEYVERAVADVQARRGRRPLTDDTPAGEHSPRVSFRVPEQTRRRAEERARTEGRSVSDLAREALERYLAS